MKKIIAAVALLGAVSSPAFADIDNFDLSAFVTSPLMGSKVRALATHPGDENAALALQDAIMDSPAGARNAFNAWSNDDRQSEYTAWPEVGLNMLRWLEPSRSFDWKNGVRVPGYGQVVYQQDSLVDLDRTMAVNVSFTTVQDQGRGYTLYDTQRGPSRIPATSKSLLRQGYAPIGPDNVPVWVCRMGLGSQAPYVELSQTQKVRFAEETGLVFSSCLNGAPAQVYWKDRYSDFFDSYYDMTDRNHPGGSY